MSNTEHTQTPASMARNGRYRHKEHRMATTQLTGRGPSLPGCLARSLRGAGLSGAALAGAVAAGALVSVRAACPRPAAHRKRP